MVPLISQFIIYHTIVYCIAHVYFQKTLNSNLSTLIIKPLHLRMSLVICNDTKVTLVVSEALQTVSWKKFLAAHIY